MMTIWKYEIVSGKVISLQMPASAEILTVQTQFNEPVLWALVNTENTMQTRYFEVFGTGHTVPDLSHNGRVRSYVNTFQINGGNLVFHLFELASVEV